jgi:hypothetical protein
MVRLLLACGPVLRPVDVIRLLASHGLPLREAHIAMDRLADGKRVLVEVSDPSIVAAALERLGVWTIWRSDDDLMHPGAYSVLFPMFMVSQPSPGWGEVRYSLGKP